MSENLEDYKQNLKDPFTQVYLTLISVIQGVVLGYMAAVADDSYEKLNTYLSIIFVTTFIRIIATWHDYAIGIVISAWPPTIADSIIPFFIGAIEFLLISSTRSSVQTWLLAMAALNIGYLLAYLNHHLQVSRGHAGVQVRASLMIGMLIQTGLWIALWGLSEIIREGEQTRMSLAIVALLLGCVQLATEARFFQRELHNYLNRPRTAAAGAPQCPP